MYKISVKKGFNILIKDLDVSLNGFSGTLFLTKEQFESSKDILKVKKFLDIEEVEDFEKEEINNSISDDISKVGNNSFVHNGSNLFTTLEDITKHEIVDNEVFETLQEEVVNILNVKDDIFVHSGENSFSEPNEEKGEFVPKQTKKPGRKKKN